MGNLNRWREIRRGMRRRRYDGGCLSPPPAKSSPLTELDL
jgi:hypothetical protein